MILGIDLGSSAFKTAVFDQTLSLLGTGAAEVIYHPMRAGCVEMPVKEAEQALVHAIQQAVKSSGMDPASLQAVSVTSQAQTFTVVSPQGIPRCPFISWRDARAQSNNIAALCLKEFAKHSGVDSCLPLLMVAKLAYMQCEMQERLVKERDLVMPLPTWFIWHLTGHAVVDVNLAAMSGLYSFVHRDWWDEALTISRIQKYNLPALSRLGDIAGITHEGAQRFGIPAGLPVITAGNDQTAGAYGVSLHTKDAVLITLGTAQVAYVVHEHIPAPAPGMMRGPYPCACQSGSLLYYQMAADDCGSGTVTWAQSHCDFRNVKDIECAAASAQADCGGVTFVADGPAGSGHWEGVSAQTTKGEKARAVYMCLSQRMSSMIASFRPMETTKRLLVTGGGSASSTWCECLETVLGRPVLNVDAAPVKGAARMAIDALNLEMG